MARRFVRVSTRWWRAWSLVVLLLFSVDAGARPTPPPSPRVDGDAKGGRAPAEASPLVQMSLQELMDLKIDAATRTSTPLRKIPNRVVVITDEDMRRRGYRYLIDVLEDLPGVQSMRNMEPEWGSLLFVRGVWQNNKILILYNGQKVNSPENRDHYFGNYAWSLHNVKRIEFIYGPASALYGADAVSGIINIVTYDAEDMGEHHVRLSLDAGTWLRSGEHRVDADLSAAAIWGPLRLHASGAFHDSGGPRLIEDYPKFYAPFSEPKYRQQGGKDEDGVPGGPGPPIFTMPSRTYHISVNAELGDTLRIQYMRWWARQSSSIGYNVPVFEFSPEAAWTMWQDNIGLSHRLVLDDRFTLNSRAGFNRQELDPSSKFVQSFFLDGAAFTREDFKYLRSTRFSLNEELAFESHNGRVTAIGGVRFENIYSLSKISTTTGEPFQRRYPAGYQVNPATPAAEVNFRSFGVYSQVQWKVVEGLDVIGGLNLDKVWYFPWSVNPRVGLTWAAADELTLRASYGKAYLTPSPMYMFEGFNNVAFPGEGTIGAVPNTKMEPENYHTVEIGGTVAPLASFVAPGHFDLLLDVSAYLTRNTNYLLRSRTAVPPVEYIPAIGNTPAQSIDVGDGAVALFTNENAGEIWAYGVDISLSARFRSWANLWLHYSYLDGKMKEDPKISSGDGFDIDFMGNQAAHVIKAGIDVRAYFPGLHVVPRLTWYSDYKMRPEAPFNLEGATLSRPPIFDLSIIYEHKRFDIWGLARNLTDRRYSVPGSTVSQLAPTRQPQDRFSFLAGFTLRL